MIALITGANRGIGRHIALGLSATGASVALVGRNADGLEAAARECLDAGAVAALPVVADVVDRAAVVEAVDTVVDELAAVDFLINNAAIIEAVEAPFGDVDVDETWRVVEVGARGPMNVTHAVLPVMLDGDGGRIVNINSGSSYRAGPIYTGYGVAKAALAQLTRTLDTQYRDRGIRVFDVAPGVVETGMTTSMPIHSNRTDWTPPSAVVELLIQVAEGSLDDLSGRFIRAGSDTVESLLKQRDEIIGRDARVLRLVPISEDDPLA